MIKEFFKYLFTKNNSQTRNEVKKRLKLIIAHDRSSLNALILEKMRKEILIVVSKYVELDSKGIEFSIKMDNKITALIVNLPIKKILHTIDQTS
nr:septum-site determining protein [Cryptomonas sp. NIES-345]BDA98365.1 septum-site determining protein [Cryptomonas sp. NIES-1327]